MMGGNEMKYENPYIELIELNGNIITSSLDLEEDMGGQDDDVVEISI